MTPLIPAVVLVTGALTGLLATQPKSVASNPPPTVVAARPAPTPAGHLPPRLNKQQRTVLLEQLHQAQRQATLRRGPARPPAPIPVAPELDRDYIRAQIQGLIPLLKECYDSALLSHHFAGKLVVQFTIVAAKDIGGLVTGSTIDTAQSTITDGPMRECVQETMYAAQFPAPLDGGEVQVSYPFVFSE